MSEVDDIHLENVISKYEEKLDCISARLKEAEIVIDICRKLIQHKQDRSARVSAMQKAASIARKGGPSGKAVIEEMERKHPVVFDIGDIVNEIEIAIKNYDKKQ